MGLPCRKIRVGLSLAEIMLAIGLLAILITVLIGLFLRLNLGATKTLDRTMALELANRILEEHSANSPQTWNFQDRFRSEAIGRAPLDFEYKLDATLLSATNNPMGDLYRLDVDVSWWPEVDKSRPRRDYGVLSLRLSRVVFVQSLRP